MLLSGDEILEAVEGKRLVIEPLTEANLQPASIDLMLHHTIQVQRDTPVVGIKLNPETLDIQDHLERYTDNKDISEQPWEFKSHQFVIGRTVEIVGLPLDLAGRVEGRSRLARLGVGVHITAPKIDTGFKNQITLEI